MAKFCSKCGKFLSDGTIIFCPECGTRQDSANGLSVLVGGDVKSSQVNAAGHDIHIHHDVLIQPCKVCNGKGKVKRKVTCPDCKGKGRVFSENGSMTACTTCGGHFHVSISPPVFDFKDGSGSIEVDVVCKYCDGQGWIRI